MAQYVKNNPPDCPPIVGKENLTPKGDWKTVKRKSTSSRQMNATECSKSQNVTNKVMNLTTLTHKCAKTKVPPRSIKSNGFHKLNANDRLQSFLNTHKLQDLPIKKRKTRPCQPSMLK